MEPCSCFTMATLRFAKWSSLSTPRMSFFEYIKLVENKHSSISISPKPPSNYDYCTLIVSHFWISCILLINWALDCGILTFFSFTFSSLNQFFFLITFTRCNSRCLFSWRILLHNLLSRHWTLTRILWIPKWVWNPEMSNTIILTRSLN